jgi:hypothetical protein
MSNSLTSLEAKELLEKFHEKRSKQVALQDKHEQAGNFGMAYLALWAVVEDFAKHLGPKCQKVDLHTALTSWLAYLDGNGSKQPQKISAGKFEIAKSSSEKIPPDTLLMQVFHKEIAPGFYEVLSTDGKYRKSRNSIAHSGEDVSQKRHDGFKNQVSIAFTEIEAWLVTQIGQDADDE